MSDTISLELLGDHDEAGLEQVLTGLDPAVALGQHDVSDRRVRVRSVSGRDERDHRLQPHDRLFERRRLW